MAEIKKYLDLEGLSTYDEKIKEAIQSSTAEAKGYADSLADNYDPAGTAQTKVDALANGTVAQHTTQIASLQSGKADKSTTLSGYGITDAYTKSETDAKISAAVANADHLKREIVTKLPDTDSADENTIYMVGSGAGSEDSVYEEYMLINGGFEKIGSSEVDLTNYALKSYVDSAKTEAKEYADSLSSNYATADQGALADSALQKADITTGGANGTIAVDGTDVAVKGLGSAAYQATSAFDAAGAANTAETNAKSYADSLAGNYATAAQGALADSALQKADITSGTGNGTIAVDGTDVAVKGLASAAYRTAGTAAGNVPINGASLGTTANVPVVTNASGQLVPHASGALGTAAFAPTTAFDAAGTAESKVTELENGQVKTNTDNIAALSAKVESLEGTSYTPITEEEILALFA